MAGNGFIIGTLADKPLILGTNSTNRVHITATGNVGIGTTSPTHPLEMASGAFVTTGGVWTNASSRELIQLAIAAVVGVLILGSVRVLSKRK